jgi:hypothetical protein
VVQRKDLSDLVHSCTTDRCVFINRLRRMANYPHRLLLVTSTLSQIKWPYSHLGGNPNRITQSLIAILAGLGPWDSSAKSSESSQVSVP